MEIRVLVKFINKNPNLNESGEEITHFIKLHYRQYGHLIIQEPIDLADLNMKIQDNFYFVDAVIAQLGENLIDLPNRDFWYFGCLIVEAADVKLDLKSEQFYSIYSDFHTTL
jgi:hypothetical protein